MPPTPVPVPRAVRWVAIASLIGSAVLVLLGAWRIGVTWDEPLHVQRYNNYVQTGWYLGDGQVEHGKPTEDMEQQYVYGPVTMTLLHGLGRLAGTDDPGRASATADAYAVRHLGVGLIGLLGVLAVIATGRLLLRSWDWGLVAGAILAVVPLWTGHSMFNMKDVPVASGYALATLGLAVLARERAASSWMYAALGPLALATGIFLAMGTRPGMWTGIAASVGALVVCRLVRRIGKPLLEGEGWFYRELVLGLAVAGVGLWAIYPKVYSSPLHAMLRAALGSANFLDATSSWTFVPVRVLLQVPLLILGLCALGTVVAIRQLVRTRLRPGAFEMRLVLTLVQMLTLPVIAIVHGAGLYGDLRQLLFSVPATAVLAAYGARALVGRARRAADRTVLALVAGLTSAAMLVPLADQALLFPYDYTYYNPLATVAGVHGDGDYYRASGRGLVPEIPTNGRIVCTPQTGEDGLAMRVAHLDGWVDCAHTLSSPIAAYLDERRGPGPTLRPDQFWAVSFNRGNAAAKNCHREKSTYRRTWWGRLRLASLLLCERPFPVVGAGVTPFSGKPRSGVDIPDLGWYSFGTDSTLDGIRSRGGTSTMLFGLDPALAGSSVTFAFTAESTDDVAVSFAGESFQSSWQQPDSDRPVLRVTIPAPLVDKAVASAQTLSFSSPDETRLYLKILSMTVSK